MQILRWITSLGAATILVGGLVACSSENTGTGGSSSSTTSSSTGGTAGGGGMAGGGGAGGIGGGGGMGGSEPSSGYCQRTCTTAKDCCPNQMDPNCPGADYPYNYTCNAKGTCEAPQCKANGECVLAGYKCFTITAKGSCRKDCTADPTVCEGTDACTGVADNGDKFCQSTSECMTNADCGGYGACINSFCVCLGNADCTAPTTTCVLP